MPGPTCESGARDLPEVAGSKYLSEVNPSISTPDTPKWAVVPRGSIKETDIFVLIKDLTDEFRSLPNITHIYPSGHVCRLYLQFCGINLFVNHHDHFERVSGHRPGCLQDYFLGDGTIRCGAMAFRGALKPEAIQQ